MPGRCTGAIPRLGANAMKFPSIRLLASALLVGAAIAGPAAAQSYGAYPEPDDGGYTGEYDYARVIRVDPIIDRGNGAARDARDCYYRESDGYYAGDDRGYRDDDGYDGDGRDYRRDDGYARGGSDAGRAMSTVLGSVVGAVLGSQVGGGSGRMVGTVVGSTAGAVVGRSVYENAQRQRDVQRGTVRVCDPEPADGGYGAYGREDERVVGYDVTYEYAGRVRHTRTDYHPGDRIRVRVLAE